MEITVTHVNVLKIYAGRYHPRVKHLCENTISTYVVEYKFSAHSLNSHNYCVSVARKYIYIMQEPVWSRMHLTILRRAMWSNFPHQICFPNIQSVGLIPFPVGWVIFVRDFSRTLYSQHRQLHGEMVVDFVHDPGNVL